ncbi:MAG: hypothetical protein IPP55_02475 [Anaerolineales bacterium]|nr:hypothetical protein [Anaerolineales bacterium]
MKTKLWTTVFVVGLLILLTHFVWVTPALADDVTPPPVPTEEVVVETLPPTEEPVAEVLPIETVATEEPVVVEPVATEPPTTEEPVPVDLLQDLPADTSLVVLGENGEVLPLATQEAAEVMAVADPMWCPAGVTTVTVDCVNDTTIGTIGSGNLLDKIIAKVTTLDPIHGVNGVIYFTPTYSVNDVLFDGSLPAINFEGNALTLQGGWDGDTTQDSTITLSGSSTFSVPISITKWRKLVI